jgi:hypothetical protein
MSQHRLVVQVAAQHCNSLMASPRASSSPLLSSEERLHLFQEVALAVQTTNARRAEHFVAGKRTKIPTACQRKGLEERRRT